MIDVPGNHWDARWEATRFDAANCDGRQIIAWSEPGDPVAWTAPFPVVGLPHVVFSASPWLVLYSFSGARFTFARPWLP